MSVRAVVFDIGNVLIHWQPEGFFDRVLGADRRADFFAAVPILDMNERVDAGENFHDALAELAKLYPDWSEEIALWRDRWIEIASPAIDQSVRLLRACRRAGHSVFALSNFGVETFQMAEREYPFLEEFDQRFISGPLGIVKPMPEIYQRVEENSGLPPEALLFTDDRPENIEAAKRRGWQTHLFDGPEGFAARLVQDGVLTVEAAE